jgi:hypothetical protein
MTQFMNFKPLRLAGAFAALALLTVPARAWDYPGHRFVNQLALASLPTNFPAFALTPAARERIAFLAGEADRWRNSPDLPFKHFHEPDHYFDLDELPLFGMKAGALTHFRYEFAAQLAAGRAAHATNFPPLDAARNADKTREWIGFLPWSITEYQGKLKAGFSCLRALENGGTTEEIANAQQNIIYVMGVMGHFVGDGGQPLHMTKHHHGWVGDNPRGYSTNRSFHQWIDGGYIQKAGLTYESLAPKVRAARVLTAESPVLTTNLFPVVMRFLTDTFQQVEPLYELEKQNQLSGRTAGPGPGLDFLGGQMLKSGQFLGDLWLTAWHDAPRDTFLERELAKRSKGAAGAAKPE